MLSVGPRGPLEVRNVGILLVHHDLLLFKLGVSVKSRSILPFLSSHFFLNGGWGALLARNKQSCGAWRLGGIDVVVGATKTTTGAIASTTKVCRAGVLYPPHAANAGTHF